MHRPARPDPPGGHDRHEGRFLLGESVGVVEAPSIVCGISLEMLFKIARELDVIPSKLLEDED